MFPNPKKLPDDCYVVINGKKLALDEVQDRTKNPDYDLFLRQLEAAKPVEQGV
jgi:hypothetical protein